MEVEKEQNRPIYADGGIEWNKVVLSG